MEQFDVAVVGGGLMGSATALALSRRGLSTVLLEQHQPGHRLGASHGAVRIFRLSYPAVDYVRLSQRALGCWGRLEDEAGEQLLITTGGVDAGPVTYDCAAALGEAGVRYEWLTAAAAAERFPAIDFVGLDRVLLQPDGGVVLADRTLAAQYRLARAAGVDLRTNSRVRDVQKKSSGLTIVTDGGEIAAGIVVLTPGPWAGTLATSALGRALPIRSTLQVVVHFAPAATDDDHLVAPMPTFVEWVEPTRARYAVPPVGVAPGVKMGEHDPGPEVDPSNGPFGVDEARVRPVIEFARRRVPGVSADPIATETCLYSLTVDEDFILDRIGDVVIGAGFSGHGFKFGPLIGEVLADLATGRDPELPPGRFSLDRESLRASRPGG
jgi:sarcosine oxidase